MSNNRFAPIPFHRLRKPAMGVLAGYYRHRDRRETADAQG